MKSVLFHPDSGERRFEANVRKLPGLLAHRLPEPEPADESRKAGNRPSGASSTERGPLELMHGIWNQRPCGDLFSAQTTPAYIDSGTLARAAVARFRRLGQEVFPASIRYASGEHVFGMALHDENGLSVIRAMPPFFRMRLPDRSASVELLSGDAFQCLLRLKAAYLDIRQLIKDAASRPPYSECEGALRAAAAGHELYEARRFWTVDEALGDIASSLGFSGNPLALEPGMESIRHIYERSIVHKSTCADCHLEMVMEELGEAGGLSGDPASGGPIGMLRVYAELMGALHGIDGHVSAIKSHLHDTSECELVDGAGRN